MQPTQQVDIAPRWMRALALGLLAFALSILAWWPMFAAYPATQAGDGAFFHKSLEAIRISLVRWHELPQWNPYDCGGAPLWANPQLPAAAPMIWPIVSLGTLRTVHLWYVGHSAIGFAGAWLFARSELRVGRAAAFFAATAWAFCGFHQQHYHGGHLAFVGFLYFPLALLFWRRAEASATAAVLLGLLVAWTMLEGGIYPLPHLAVILAVETLTRLRSRARLVAIVRAAAIVLVVALFVGGIRFLPVMSELRAHKRPLPEEHDLVQWTTLKDMFLVRTHERGVLGQEYVWPEYGAYLGPIVLALAVVGVVLCGIEDLWLLLLLVFSFALMLGHLGKYAPWSFLKLHVYPFTQMRVPSRFRAEVSLFAIALAAIAVDRLPGALRRFLVRFQRTDLARTVLFGLAMIAAGDILSVGAMNLQGAFTEATENYAIDVSPRFHYGGSPYVPLVDLARANRGRLQCWEEWAFGEGAPLWEGDVPQARPEPGAKATVANVQRTQNTFTFDVVADAPATIQLNTVYDRGFRTNVGALRDVSKQLVLDVPSGRHHVRVAYRAPLLVPGAILSALGLLGVLLFFALRNRPLPTRRAAK